jgi:hypothetical protein
VRRDRQYRDWTSRRAGTECRYDLRNGRSSSPPPLDEVRAPPVRRVGWSWASQLLIGEQRRLSKYPLVHCPPEGQSLLIRERLVLAPDGFVHLVKPDHRQRVNSQLAPVQLGERRWPALRLALDHCTDQAGVGGEVAEHVSSTPAVELAARADALLDKTADPLWVAQCLIAGPGPLLILDRFGCSPSCATVAASPTCLEGLACSAVRPDCAERAGPPPATKTHFAVHAQVHVLISLGAKLPHDEATFWVAVHKARRGARDLPMAARPESKRWLTERGDRSFDDGDGAAMAQLSR